MKRVIVNFLAGAFLAAALISCDKDNDPKQTSAEAQKEAVLAALAENCNLSEFAEALEKVNFSNVKADALTVFAVENGGMTKSSLKATDNDFNIKRHIVKGKHAKSSLTDGSTLTALDGSTLTIKVEGGKIYINGVELLGNEIAAGNSIVFIVEKAIPATWDEDGVFDGTIRATVVDGNDYNSEISKVVAFAYTGDESNLFYEEIASGSYSNGGFTLTLPSAPTTKFLFAIEEALENVLYVSGLTISDKNAKVCFTDMSFLTYDSDDEYFGSLEYGRWDKTSSNYAIFAFVDRDVTVSGSVSDKVYNMSLKNGWNIVYITYDDNTYSGTVSTNAVSGLKWDFW